MSSLSASFDSLMIACKETSLKLGSPILARGKAKAAGLSAGLENVKANLSFKFLDSPDFNAKAVKVPGGDVVESLSLGDQPEAKKKSEVILNWIVTLTNQIINHVNQLGEIIKINTRSIDEKAEKSLVADLKAKVEMLELDNDDIRQRSMTGNIIIASPHREGNPSLAVRHQVQDRQRNCMRQESVTEMCVRLVREKTTVDVPLCDVVACHPIGKGKGADTTFVLRVINRNPGSAWDCLSSALLTGKNKQTSQFVNNQMNCFISFQLTPRRGELMKKIKLAKMTCKSLRYGADQSGRITVRVNERCKFEEVKNEADLTRILANPTLNPAFRNYRG